jgi:hypothetical protein
MTNTPSRTGWPEILVSTPMPRLEQISVANLPIPIWSGKVKVDSIKGWQENPRIRVLVSQFRNNFGRDPDQDDIYEMMKKDENSDLKRLRDDIISNGVRHPVWLSKNGKLLDGNRRYFAVRYALESLGESDPRRTSISMVPAYVLTEDSDEEAERRVVVQMNFSDDLKMPWPDLVKAMMVYEDHQKGLSEIALQKKYDWNSSKVKSAIRTYGIIEEFRAFATEEKSEEDFDAGGLGKSDNEANDIANKHYQKFNEAQKSFREALDTDTDFKRAFFRMLASDKFRSWAEVRTAYEAWSDHDIKPVLISPDPESADKARIMVEAKKKGVVTTISNEQRIREFSTFMGRMKIDEVRSLTPDILVELQKCLMDLQTCVDSVVAAAKTGKK